MAKGKSLSREAIFAANDIKKQRVEVPEWDGYVWVQQLSARGAGTYNSIDDDDDHARVMARSVASCTYNDAGELLFTTQEHIEGLLDKNIAALRRVYKVVLALNGLDEDAAEEAEGNSEAAPSDSSSSD